MQAVHEGTKPAVPRSLFITNDFPPRLGGAQSSYWGLVNTLDPDQVVIVAPSQPGAEEFDTTHRYRVVRAPMKTLWPTPALERLARRLVVDERIELVQLGHPLPAGLLGPRLARSTGRPYLVFLGGAEVTVPAALPIGRRLLRHVLGRASLLVCVSEFTARQAFQVVAGSVPVRVLRPPLDTEALRPASPQERAAARAALGVDGELVVCLGRLVPRKGQDRLIDAAGLLAGECPGLRLTLIGDGRLRARLHERAQRRAVAERVLLTGPLPSADVRRWLAAADVFASPVRTRWNGLEVEGFGLVFAEAALAGLPVVAGVSGGSSEALDPGRTGLLADGRSAESVAATLRGLLRMSQGERAAMGAEGRALALSRHSPEVAGRRYRDLLREAVSGRQAPAGLEAGRAAVA